MSDKGLSDMSDIINLSTVGGHGGQVESWKYHRLSPREPFHLRLFSQLTELDTSSKIVLKIFAGLK